MIVDQRFRYQSPPPDNATKMFHSQKQRPLTEKQRKILDYLRGTFELTKELPTLTVLARRFRMAVECVVSALKALARKGYLEMEGRRTKTMRLTEKAD